MASVRWVMSLVVLIIVCKTGEADSSFFQPAGGYQVSDVLTEVFFDGYDTLGNNVIGWTGGHLKMYEKNGAEVKDFGSPASYSFGWNNFVRLDPSGNSAWVGMSVGGNSDDRIYEVDLDTNTWDYKATIGGNIDLAFHAGNAFVCALDETLTWGTASIWLMDSSGANEHDLIASIGGNTAGLAFDNQGNLYYGTNGLASGDALIVYSATQVAGALGPNSLSLTDSEKLSDIDGGAYDTDVDGAGNVFFSANASNAYTAMWDGNAASGTNYEVIGTGKGEWGDWFRFIDCQGNVTDGGTLYQSDYYFNGVAEVTVIPEPATITLLGIAAVWLRKCSR